MKRTLLSLLALFFPWAAFLILQKPIAALGALALQLTFVGWLPAGFWAWTEVGLTYNKDGTLRSSKSAAPPPPEKSEQHEIEKTVDSNIPSNNPESTNPDEPPQS